VALIEPASPTAKHVVVDGHEMARSHFGATPGFCVVQLAPLSAVLTMVVPLVMVEQVVVEGHEMSSTGSDTPVLCVAQLDPPLVVANTRPGAKTAVAKHEVVDGQET
jgi:hypothetical protein